MSACSCSVSGSWNNIVIIWCCSIMVWISQLYFIICFMILITTFLFVGLYHNLNKPAADCQHNILWISKWLLETNNELKQAHQKMKVSFFSSWSKLAPDWTYAPNGSGSIHRRHHHHHHHDWLIGWRGFTCKVSLLNGSVLRAEYNNMHSKLTYI